MQTKDKKDRSVKVPDNKRPIKIKHALVDTAGMVTCGGDFSCKPLRETSR